MERLVNRYRKAPSPSNRAALAKYLAKHGVQPTTPSTVDFLRVHGFIA